MMRQVAAVCLGIGLSAVPASAQLVEVSFSGGYTLSEGIHTEDRIILGDLYNEVDVRSGGSYSFAIGFSPAPRALVEFMYGHQFSKFTAEGTASVDIAEMSVDTYHGNFVYHWADSAARLRPFAFVGIGATNYSFGSVLLPGGAIETIPGDTRFSTTWGAGVKSFLGRNVGVRLAFQWTPTYITSEAVGTWCDPFYGCWVVGDADYSHQFDMSGGVIIRF